MDRLPIYYGYGASVRIAEVACKLGGQPIRFVTVLLFGLRGHRRTRNDQERCKKGCVLACHWIEGAATRALPRLEYHPQLGCRPLLDVLPYRCDFILYLGAV